MKQAPALSALVAAHYNLQWEHSHLKPFQLWTGDQPLGATGTVRLQQSDLASESVAAGWIAAVRRLVGLKRDRVTVAATINSVR